MQKINLKNTSYQYLEMAFGEWLETLGFGQGTIKSLPIIIREFLHFLDTQNIQHINQLQHKHIKHYHDYISIRANERRGGALSNNYINKHLQAIEKFLEFLNHKGNHNVPSLSIRLAKLNQKEITILSTEEVKILFELTNKATNTQKETLSADKQDILQSRDRAMLTIFYSCGLRRNEGVHVCVDDINFEKKIVHVKKGKNYKERFVPLNKTNADYLQEWIYDYRSLIIKSKTQDRLFVNIHGEAMAGGTLYSRLKLLQMQSDSIELQNKTIGLHTLRHSIATHLLQAGMSLEKIARFLGHSSLESTQLYTHLIEK
jgi:integrase/recombinase XerD